MKVLIVHNRYQQRGGEDAVVASERALLEKCGVKTALFEENNDHIRGIGSSLKAAASSFYSIRTSNKITDAITAFKPDVVHVHNWFPTLSPAIFGICKRLEAPVVHTLHNYRLLCVKASLYRDGRPCEDCIGKSLRLPGIVHGCYRESRCGSAAATASMLLHWRLGTWSYAVDRFIALSQFAHDKLVQGGLPAEKIVVKPNALDYDPGAREGAGGYVAFVGRFTDEKGIPTLLDCWRNSKDLPLLRIVGSGPLEKEVREAASQLNNVEWLGPLSSDRTVEVIGDATALICPSHWYEGMPRVAVEAFAVGTPIIASRLGTFAEMIDEGHTGSLFEATNGSALAASIRNYIGSPLQRMRPQARRQFELKYSGEANVAKLLEIYKEAQHSKCGPVRADLDPVRAA